MDPQKINSEGYDTDKGLLYLEVYNKYFGPLKDQNICLLELGIKNGGSLLMWRDYFPNGTIIGLDVKPVSIESSMDRIQVYTGLQQDEKIFNKMRSESATEGFDIIIDDASHIGELSELSFRCLFDNHLKKGGLYIIEDWRTGYWNKWPDGKIYKFKKFRVFSFLRKALDNRISASLSKSNSQMNSIEMKYSDKILFNLRNIFSVKRIKSHSYGMVGFLKSLVDELGMDMITNPERGSKLPYRESRFLFMNIYPGIVVIQKKY